MRAKYNSSSGKRFCFLTATCAVVMYFIFLGFVCSCVGYFLVGFETWLVVGFFVKFHFWLGIQIRNFTARAEQILT